MTGCNVSTARHSTGKDASLQTVRVFILLLWVPFCCVCAARFFLLLWVRGVLFFASGALALAFCCGLLPAASEHLLQKDIQGPGRVCVFAAGTRAHSLTRRPPPGAPTAKKHPQQKKHGLYRCIRSPAP